jgi:large conductance mechanosensitive channel
MDAEVGPVPGAFKDFKEFISRGNVVDLAVAVVIGAAFTAIVTAVVTGLITPIIGMIGGRNFNDIDFEINGSTFEVGLVINAVIYFLVVAAVVFFGVVKPLNVLEKRRKRGEEPVEAEDLSDEAALLVEIRDLLAAQATAAGRGHGSGDGGFGTEPTPPAPRPTDPPPSTRGW